MKILSAMILAFTSVAFADITITAGNTGSFVDKNVLFNLGVAGTSNTDPVVGYLNGTTTLVGFDSVSDDLVGNGGQARVEALSGTYTDLSFFLTGNTFLTAVLNLQPLNPAGPPQDGTVTFTIQRLGEADFVQAFDISDSGENFFSIQATNNQKILSVSYVSSLEIQDTRQIRIGGEAPIGGGDPVVPEPMTMTLMGAGLGVIGLLRKKFQA